MTAVSGRCFICRERPMERGAACWKCLDPALVGQGPGFPEILNGALYRPAAWLVDGRGVLYPVGLSTILGRLTLELVILHTKVSRRHARIDRIKDRWSVTDLGSRHGTRVNGVVIEGPTPLQHGDCLRVGPVGFIFAEGTPEPQHHQASGQSTTSYSSVVPDEVSTPPLTTSDGHIHLTPPIPGGFGCLTVADHQLPLSPLQCNLMELLLDRLRTDPDQQEGVRGFVSSTELLVTLPWETPYPRLEALKQLIRRTRSKLSKYGLHIESYRGLGYRLHITSP